MQIMHIQIMHIIAMVSIFAIIFFAGPIDNYFKERRWAKKSIADDRPVMIYSDFPTEA
jgi:hypothetical protein